MNNKKLNIPTTAVKNILIVRLSAIGDVVHALPVAHAVRKKYPRAEISWIVEEKAYELVETNPYLDRVILLPKNQWKKEFSNQKWKTLKKVKRYFQELKKYNFDFVLDIHGLFKSGLTTFFSGANIRYGPADGREGSTLFYNHKIEPPPVKVHQVERNLYLAQAIGADTDDVDYGITVREEEKKKIDLILEPESEEIIAINPFTTWTSKDWPRKRFAELADRLKQKLDCKIVITGGPGDVEGVQEICSMMDKKSLNLAGKTSIRELAELYRRVDLFIGGDTGPLHLAAAVNTPCIALMGPTTPETHGPYGEGHTVIHKDLECKGCWKRECKKGDRSCMKKIEVDEVFFAVRKMLDF